MFKTRLGKESMTRLLPKVAIISFLSMTPIISFLNTLGIQASIYKIIMGLLCYGTVILFFMKNSSRIPKDFLLLVIMVLLYFGFTCLVYSEYMSTLPPVMWGSVISLAGGGILSYVYPRMFSDLEQIKKCILISAIINLLHYSIVGINVLNVGYWVVIDEAGITRHYESNMSYGYQVLFCCVIFIYYAFVSKGWYRWMLYGLAGISAFEIMLLGSRGALLSVFVSILMLYIASHREKLRNALSGVSIFGIIVLLLFIIFNAEIMSWISDALEKVGYNSRTISLTISGSFLDDNGRTGIAAQAMEYISNSFFFGNGMLSDRYYLGTYCHNIFLEILFDFGVPIGTAIIIWLIVKIAKYLKTSSKDELLLFVAISSIWFTRLLVSSSFWNDSFFWMSIAFMYTKFKNIYQESIASGANEYDNSENKKISKKKNRIQEMEKGKPL